MKKLLSILFSILSLSIMAQVPQGVGYQGVATDANGIELVNQAISIRASVLSGSANGTVEWEETHATTTDTFGLFALTIGQGTNTTNGAQTSFSDISWGTNTHFLKIEMDVTGGSNYSFMGTNQMMSVPYALYAENANINYDSISNLLSNDSTFITNVGGGMGGDGCDFDYPDGLNGDPIVIDLNSTSYTVPTGKNLYVMHRTKTMQNWTTCMVFLSVNGVDFWQDGGGYAELNPPFIVKSGDVISSSSSNCNTSSLEYFCMLVDAKIEPIMIDLASGNYTVPNGKKFYFKRKDPNNGWQEINIGSSILNLGVMSSDVLKNPIIINSGEVISGITSPYPKIYGYLADENYFAGCGGGGGSSSTSSLDSTTIANMIAGAGGGCNFKFPEGLDGEGVHLDLSNTTYTVPSGKRLYLLSSNNLMLVDVSGDLYVDVSVGKPAIFNSGDIIYSDNPNNPAHNALLVEENPAVISITVSPSSQNPYEVPTGKRLYLMSETDITLDGNLLVDITNAQVAVFNSGDLINLNNTSSNEAINGYLVDENYFAGCGGGGSSSGASNATIDSLYQVVSHFDSSLTALTSLLTFGCTDASALNYDPIANTDNGLCTYAPLAIGNFYQGGIIFYLDGNGGGLVCLVNDINIDLEWGCWGYPMPGADGTAIGTGFQNTIDIVNANCSFGGNGIGIAANICENLTHEGYSDWFLPSKDELNQMFINKDIINLGSGIAFGSILGYTYYWSSTEGDDFNACLQDFTNGNQSCNAGTKYGVNGVRAIRAF